MTNSEFFKDLDALAPVFKSHVDEDKESRGIIVLAQDKDEEGKKVVKVIQNGTLWNLGTMLSSYMNDAEDIMDLAMKYYRPSRRKVLSFSFLTLCLLVLWEIALTLSWCFDYMTTTNFITSILLNTWSIFMVWWVWRKVKD